MKLRILVPPFLIVIIIVLIVWYVYPGFQGLRDKGKELGDAVARVEKMRDKNSKADLLLKKISSQPEQKSTLLKYIPENKQEEDMISNLNALASAAGLSVYNISITVPKETVTTTAAAQTEEGVAPNPTGLAGSGVASPKPAAKNFTVTLGVVGGYEKIKDLVGKVAALQRFNSIESMKIAKVKSTTGGSAGSAGAAAPAAAGTTSADDSSSNNLQADIALNFNYIEKSNLVVNVDNEIFSSGSFDMNVVDQIRNSMSTVVNSLTVGTAGAANPFVK